MEADDESESSRGDLMEIREIMAADPICCTADTSLEDVAGFMREQDCGEIPVVENFTTRKVIGVITDRDITCRAVALGRNPLDLTAKDCMSTPVVAVPPELSVEECCRVMEAKQIRRVPVVNSERACVGIVSQADLAKHASQQLTAELVLQVSRPTDGLNR
jgi:CBS domain-containing protein